LTEPTGASYYFGGGYQGGTMSQPGDATAARSNSYIARHWRGELSLPKSFWLNGFLIGLISRVLFSGLLTGSQFLGSVSVVVPVFLALQTLNLLVVVWILVGIWRAASNYAGRRLWAILAKIVVVIGALGSIAIVAKNLSVLGEIVRMLH
jgi:hypothetical protein